MKFLITAGGTGGHIYPALSVIDIIKQDKNNKYLYVGTKNRMESEIVPSLDIPYKSIEIYGLNKSIVRNLKNISCIIKSYKESKKILKEFKPDVVVAFGGYVTFPLVLAAHKMGVKVVLHEQNVIPGKTNKILARFADKIFISFEESKKYFKESKVIYSGNPCLQRAQDMPKVNKTQLGFEKSKKLIIIVMGSLGSSVVNEKLLEFLRVFEESDKEILFITGKDNYVSLFNNLKIPRSTQLVAYYDKLPGLMKSADLIISRAGASIISEILGTNIPSILIPSPYVANNHQYYNALNLVNKDLSMMMDQDSLNKETLKNAIKEILDDKTKNTNMIDKLKNENKPLSSTIMYKEIKKLVK